MLFRVELWPIAPPDDLEAWQEAFAAPLEVDDGGIAYYSPTLDYVDLPVPPGYYQIRITGRGFVGHGWPGQPQWGTSGACSCGWPTSGQDRIASRGSSDPAPRGASWWHQRGRAQPGNACRRRTV